MSAARVDLDCQWSSLLLNLTADVAVAGLAQRDLTSAYQNYD